MTLTASIAAPHPAAVAAARAAWAEGGNALDLAVAAATALAVVYPHQCSLGGDLVALVREPDGAVRAIVSTGAAPQRVDVDALRAAGERMPSAGPHPVTVPGVLAGWAAVLDHGAALPLAAHVRRAATLAREGSPVSSGLAWAIGYRADGIAADPGLREVFAPGGTPLTEGDPLLQPRLAETLDAIADGGPAALYGGAIGAALAAGLEQAGSAMRLDDLAAHDVELTEPLTADALGATWHVAPPPTQGATLLALLAQIDADARAAAAAAPAAAAPDAPATPAPAPLSLDRARAASAARDRLLGDPRVSQIDLDGLRLASAAAAPAPAAFNGARPHGDTVAVTAVDSDGRAVTLIQSVYQTFGAGLLEPTTGIVLHNRGSAFSLLPGHPGALAPGARPPHTLCPALVETADGTVVALGCQGGRAQPQVLAQLAADVTDPASDLPRAIARGRWVVGARDMDRAQETVLAEPGAAHAPESEAADAGVAFERLDAFTGLAGHVQAARLSPDGSQHAAAAPRADGAALTLTTDDETEATPS
ncbi:MAG TPA: gamma-glutamyltransferase [Conexibacter sp.]|nr:gamma-glutamyltransferase [Conexibacter sp.]